MEKRKLTAKDLALIICFSALYTILCFIPAFPIVGLSGAAITFASIIAPIIGIVLGPYLAVLSTTFGGTLGLFFASPFSPPSFAAGITSAFMAGMLLKNKKALCILTYLLLLSLFGLYPFTGPIWIYPPFMWFQIIGFLTLMSPLQSKAVNIIQKNSQDNSNYIKLSLAFFTIFLISSLSGQIAGSLTYETLFIFVLNPNSWLPTWIGLTWIYPVERMIITASATVIGVPLYKVLKSSNFIHYSNS
ncbi:hypothetical protein J7L49_01075 [Candidatus Bathyarchaeota archaeon]|nr:hypothetical protein [Candidatus Bathyarchaeota archaeon]